MNIAAIATQAQAFFNDLMGEKPTPKWLETFLSGQLPMAVALLLLLMISWRMADLTWSLLPAPEIQQQVVPRHVANTPSGNGDPASISQLDQVAKLHLFGIAGAIASTKTIDKKAPETRLNLTLHGVFVAAEPDEGEAIIGTSGSVQKYYKAGGAVMSGVTLQAVFEDRVVLLRNGQSEVLRFPKSSSKNIATVSRTSKRTSKSTVTPSSGPVHAPARNLSRYRDMLKNEPLKIFEHVRFVPVRSREGTKGYRVLPQKNRELYNQLGVRPSDLVTGVNGVPLTNDKEAMSLIQKLKDAQSIEVDIIRNGQPQSLTFDLN